MTNEFLFSIILSLQRGVAQLVEYWSPKPWVVGSSPSAPAKNRSVFTSVYFLLAGSDELSPSVLRRLENIVENSRSRGLPLGFLLIFFGRVVKNSYQLFFPRLPSAPANKKRTLGRQKFSFCLSKPQAWHIIDARSAAYIISPLGCISSRASVHFPAA